jgi:hypothetical protein
MKRMFFISLFIILPFIQNRIIFSQDFREEAWKLPGTVVSIPDWEV